MHGHVFLIALFLHTQHTKKKKKNSHDALHYLSDEGHQAPQEPLAITPNYISHPVFPYASSEFRNGVPESPRVPGTSQSTSHTPVTSVTSQIQDSQGEPLHISKLAVLLRRKKIGHKQHRRQQMTEFWI